MRRRLIAPAAVLALCALTTSAALAGDGGVGPGGDDPNTTSTGKTHLFPVPGKHTYGDGFGAGRDHEGQDIFARCGKPIIAARAGRVIYRGNDGAAGNYIVIDGQKTERDYAYLHLKRRSPFKKGAKVGLGERIGRVGDTGNASGCHLHFELWRGDWNGQPDVTRKLRKWDSWS
jgi:murein DD-endopeptidase MepM/ murein hydrolase activator NlpD